MASLPLLASGRYTSTAAIDGSHNIVLHAITAMPQYADKSFDELRLEDYNPGNKGSAPVILAEGTKQINQSTSRKQRINTNTSNRTINRSTRHINKRKGMPSTAPSKDPIFDTKSNGGATSVAAAAQASSSSSTATPSKSPFVFGSLSSEPATSTTTTVSSSSSSSSSSSYPPMTTTVKTDRCVTEPAQLCGGEEGRPITSRWIEDGPSERMKKMLDTIDNVRTTLGGLKHTKCFYEELLSSLPQFVTCGPQSAGKSSVIRRVSGVYLPEASTLCTRMATIIQMRRSSSSLSSYTTIVTLTGPNGFKILEDKVDDDDDDGGGGSEEGSNSRSTSVRNLIKKAQEKALEMFPLKQFIQDHSINVSVTGPNLVNVTLVDLPGFHTSDDADTKTVNEMVKRYVDMPGTLVLHVVKGDQDYASLLGNDFMRRRAPKHDAGRVTVLTHCDKLDVTSEADTVRLQTTLDTTTINSTLTIAVMGNAKDDDYEQTKLNHLTTMEDRLEVGAKALSIHLEDRMREHMNTQFPKAVAKLESSLVDTIKKLESIRERSPVEILCEMVQTIRENFRNEKNKLMNDLRLVLEKMTTDIKNFQLRPVKVGKTCFVSERDKFDDEFEPGQRDGSRSNNVLCTVDDSVMEGCFGGSF